MVFYKTPLWSSSLLLYKELDKLMIFNKLKDIHIFMFVNLSQLLFRSTCVTNKEHKAFY